MNASLMFLEMAVVALGVGVLLVDLWTPVALKRSLGWAVAAALGTIFLASFSSLASPGEVAPAFGGACVQDALSLFFKRCFLGAGLVVVLISVEDADRIASGIAEFYALLCFALAGMMLAASAQDLMVMFVALELITVTFYVLVSFQRTRVTSLEAGVKYLILGALASGFLVFGMAFVFGTANTMRLPELAARSGELAGLPLFQFGVLMVLVGLGFKIAAFPFQIWVPDVYQGAPMAVTAFLAVGSKAAGFVLVLRLLVGALPEVLLAWESVLMVMAGLTILYGSLCAIPQRNLKRLLGYSSVANAGFLLMGVVTASGAGSEAVVFYLFGYLFTVLTAFAVICIVGREADSEDLSVLAGLSRRSPWLAGALTMAMVSLAGLPPMAGFFGKFLLLKAVFEEGAAVHAYYWLVAVALVGVVISLYYYFNVIRAMYWMAAPEDRPAPVVSGPLGWAVGVGMGGMLVVGVFPAPFLRWAGEAARALVS